jgi:hypothetical protein
MYKWESLKKIYIGFTAAGTFHFRSGSQGDLQHSISSIFHRNILQTFWETLSWFKPWLKNSISRKEDLLEILPGVLLLSASSFHILVRVPLLPYRLHIVDGTDFFILFTRSAHFPAVLRRKTKLLIQFLQTWGSWTSNLGRSVRCPCMSPQGDRDLVQALYTTNVRCAAVNCTLLMVLYFSRLIARITEPAKTSSCWLICAM